jgi:hypothetical protein
LVRRLAAFAPRVALLCFGLGAFAEPALAAARIALMPPSGVNVWANHLEAARDILKGHLIGRGHFDVVMLPGAPTIYEPSVDETLTAGRGAGAALVASLHVTRLEGAGRARLVVWKTDSGEVDHADQIAVAGGVDDLDPAMARLVAGLVEHRPVRQVGQIDTVTGAETQPLLRRRAAASVGVRLGGVLAANRPTGDALFVPGIGGFVLYDAREYLGELFLDIDRAGAEDVRIVNLGIGAYLPFSQGNLMPYVGGGAAWSFVDLGGSGASGVRLHLSGGMLVGRLSTLRVRLEGGYFLNTFGERVGEPTRNGEPSAATHVAHGLHVTMGLAF